MTTMPDFARKPILCGEKVLLRPFQPEDIEPMMDILSDYEVVKLTGSACTEEEAHAPLSQEEAEKENTGMKPVMNSVTVSIWQLLSERQTKLLAKWYSTNMTTSPIK